MPAEFQGAADPPVEGRDFDASEASAFSAQVMFNNIQVTLLAFAGGISFGLVTVYALVFNGLILGVIAGLAIGAGNGVAFLRLVSSHGPLEISCIVVGGIAGLRMGWALIRPGVLRRGTSLRREAVPAVELAAGTVPWLVLCGVLEGFATGPELPVWFQAGLGFSLMAACSGRWCGSEDRARLRAQVGRDERCRQPVRRRFDDARARRADLSGGAGSAPGGRRRRRSPARRRSRSAPALGERLQHRVRRAGDDDGVSSREHRDGADERPRGGLLEQVAEDDDERALAALGAPERELEVRVRGGRLEVVERAHDGLAAARAAG